MTNAISSNTSITLELLNAVICTSTPITRFELIDDSQTVLFFWKGDSKLWFEKRSRVSVCRLATMCKLWANSHNAVILSWCRGDPIEHKDELFISEVYFADTFDENDGDTFELYSAPTEHEVVFKATNYVINNLQYRN